MRALTKVPETAAVEFGTIVTVASDHAELRETFERMLDGIVRGVRRLALRSGSRIRHEDEKFPSAILTRILQTPS